MESVSNLDSVGYHLSNIKWVNEYPIVGGLGNLVTGFANNNSWFLFVAFLNFFPIINNGHVIARFYFASCLITFLFKKKQYTLPKYITSIFLYRINF